MPNPINKIVFTAKQHQFLKNNYKTMTNQQLADALGLKITRVRHELYSIGLKRIQLQYWTPEQVSFLKNNYKRLGDTELAEIFAVKWFKNKPWTKNQIEKKRRYLKLKRTSKELTLIKNRNKLMGRFSECAKKRWQTTGQAVIGEKRIWFNEYDVPFVVIKTKTGFQPYNRWLWEKENGKIPSGMNVRILSEDKINFKITDLKLISNAENAVLNSVNRTPQELKTTKKLINKINKKLIKDAK